MSTLYLGVSIDISYLSFYLHFLPISAVAATASYVIVHTGVSSSFECTGTGKDSSKIHWTVPESVSIEGSETDSGTHDSLKSIYPFKSTTLGLGVSVTCSLPYDTDKVAKAAILLDVVKVSMSVDQGKMVGGMATFTCTHTAGSITPDVKFYNDGNEITTGKL